MLCDSDVNDKDRIVDEIKEVNDGFRVYLKGQRGGALQLGRFN